MKASRPNTVPSRTLTTWAALKAGQNGIGPIENFDTEDFKVHFAGEVKNFQPETFMDPKDARKADRFCQVDGWDRVYVAGDSGSFPGPDWMPKQAHMADLQASAAVANLMDAFQGKAASHGFKAELLCIVDTRSSGMLVARTPTRNIVLPNFVGFHWAKRAFELNYLRQYR